jgi:hypothetical protein
MYGKGGIYGLRFMIRKYWQAKERENYGFRQCGEGRRFLKAYFKILYCTFVEVPGDPGGDLEDGQNLVDQEEPHHLAGALHQPGTRDLWGKGYCTYLAHFQY